MWYDESGIEIITLFISKAAIPVECESVKSVDVRRIDQS